MKFYNLITLSLIILQLTLAIPIRRGRNNKKKNNNNLNALNN